MFRLFFLLSLLSTYCIVSQAQNVKIESSIDTNQILIGDQIVMTAKISVPQNVEVGFPLYKTNLIDKIEIIENTPIDTISNDENGSQTLIKRLTLTSFDTGVYMLPIGPFLLNKTDTAFGQPMFLAVNTFEIDTAKGIADIKLPYHVPITFKEVLPYILWALLIIAIIILVIFIIKKYNSKQKSETVIQKPIQLEPAHIIALRDLELLKQEKLWQKGEVKLYYTKLTEIIRLYIEYRFEIAALEQTTSEILHELYVNAVTETVNTKLLKEVFEMSDLVKFAKYIPSTEDNERNFKLMYDFVINTKQDTINTMQDIKEN